ncbi:tetratricopeptide repeat protein [Robertkochia marina]|uniref:Tetratricopeptide repeat protein n=1 Tax=Robertkochia marina TaxID=1227945 RepID=A0A4S3M201_9FLAO|nr:tetratricopeptide repeat protein [Robertkochia marina]THD67599.1 tetratricopeptide repeat protein [Robertkochia marina]TRZ44532.1 hypothetical protein D3A96_07920 [Robertkochia marina]
MKTQFYILTIILALFSIQASAQDMEKGFGFLENGEFEKAEAFFEIILKDFPENKTARLCYSRAVGLSGDPAQALELFNDLLKDYPEDVEVKLNYAEALLWNKEYEKAKPYYQDLVSKYPENFGAVLGYANTLSNLKEYQLALEAVNRALEISPENTNALVSRKYIRLGYANHYLLQRRYQSAIGLLDENLLDFPGDQETLLAKANIYLNKKDGTAAKEVYELMAISLNDSIQAFNGMALAAHVEGKEQQALGYAELAYNLISETEDSLRILETKERYVQALTWNGKYRQAEKLLLQMENEYGPEVRILALKASLGMYTGDFQYSVEQYRKILEIDSTSFDGNLGIANAYFARGEAGMAKMAADRTLIFYENQQDAEQFLKKLEKQYAPFLQQNISYTIDNGDNEAIAMATGLRFPVSSNLEISGAYRYRETKNATNGLEATSNQFDLGIMYRLSPVLRLKAVGGLVNANSVTNNYSNLVGEVSAAIKPFIRNDLEIGYRRALQDFNAELLISQITENHLFLNNNYSTSYGLGWYVQYMYTKQSDENTRNLLFTSVYYNFLKKPLLKVGLNYQYIGFDLQRPELYFSPEKFQVTEIFTDFLNNDPNADFNYNFTAAAGYQFIEDDSKQFTYRLKGRVGYQIGQRFLFSIYGNHSNIASATAAGFTFTEIGINLRWQITKTPVFKF